MFSPCVRCHRHVRSDETCCPFCGAVFVAAAAPIELPRMSRAAMIATMTALSACATSNAPATATAPAPEPPATATATAAPPEPTAAPPEPTVATAPSVAPSTTVAPSASSSTIAVVVPPPAPTYPPTSPGAAYGLPPSPGPYGPGVGPVTLYGAPPTPVKPNVAMTSDLGTDDNKALIIRLQGRMRACAVHAAKSNPDVNGLVTVTATLNVDGTVAVSKTAATGSAGGIFEACVKSAVKSAKLPARAAATGATIKVRVTPP